MTVYEVLEKLTSKSNEFEPITTWIASFRNKEFAENYAILLNKNLSYDNEFFTKRYIIENITI